MNKTNYLAVETASVGFAHIKILTNSSGEPIDIEFIYVNPAFEDLFPLKAKDFEEKSGSDLANDENIINQIIEFSTALLNKIELNFIQFFKTIDKWLRIKLVPQDGQSFFAWINDVTAERVLMQSAHDIAFSKIIPPQTIVKRFSEITRSCFSAFFRFTQDPETTSKVFFHFRQTPNKDFCGKLQSVLKDLNFDKDSIGFNEGPFMLESIKHFLNEEQAWQLEETLTNCKSHNIYLFPIISPESLEGLFICLQQKKNDGVNLKMATTYAEQIGMILFGEKQESKKQVMEEELRKSKQLYQLITENTTDGVALFRNGVFEFVSPSYSKMLDYPLSELTGITKEHFFSMIHPEDRKRIQRILDNISSKKRDSQSYAYRIARKDGEYIWFEDKLNNKFDSTGKHLATYINTRDITNQMFYEQILKDSEERFREVFNNAHDAIYIHKIDENQMPGRFIMANKEALNRMGYTLKEMKQMTPADIDSQTKRENIPDIMKNLLEKEEHVFRGEHVTKSGKIIPVENRVHLFTLKNENVIVSISRDITEEMKAQERERKHKALLQSILNTLPGKLMVIDRDYRLIAANDGLIKEISSKIWSSEEVIGKHCYEVFHSQKELCKDCNLMENKSLNAPETKIYYKDEDGIKDKKAFKLFLSPLRDDNNEKIGIIEYSVDITELKKAQRNAEKASRAKTEFMMNMSHELRTPLNGIIGFSGILEESGLDDTQREFVRNIHVSGKTLLNIVEDILNFSKIETKKVALNLEETDLKQLLTTSFKGIQEMATNKGLETQLTIDEDIPPLLLADSIKLSHVLTNLLMNAVKFTEKGSVICKVKMLSQEKEKVDILFSVSDTGIGIADDMREKIFDSFTQVDSSLTRKYGGTGLGLSISNSLLEMMQSTIRLDSKPGKGSTFSFIIPFALPEKKKKLAETRRDIDAQKYLSDVGKPFKILVVEDNFINLKLNRMIISNHFPKAEVITAENGRKAVEQFIRYRPDIIIMDIRMPDINGFEATEQIRKIEGQNWKTKIIALSADARVENIQIGMLSGLDGYITKPVEPEELIKQLESIIQKTQ